MDPVSRQLAAAAMGVVFALSRDAELEKTRLDLERARMEREDFRNGGGPDTNIMHDAPVKGSQHYYARACKYHMRPIVEYQETTRNALKRSIVICNGVADGLEMATQALARIARDGPRKRNVAISALDDLCLDSEEAARVANDGRGAMPLGLANDSEEHSEED